MSQRIDRPKRPTVAQQFACFALLGILLFPGCGIFSGLREAPFSITAVRLSPGGECEPQGIPYYLPKPLLVVAKNVRHIDESKVGLTGPVPIPGGFDNQAAFADVKANVTVPGSDGASNQAIDSNAGISAATQGTQGAQGYVAPHMTPDGRMEDGISPDSFYTYQIVFVPDLSQKYGLRICGGPGEVRAAMNLVNGWMYTGMGPFYLKDSSTAQNRIASGVQSMFTGRGAADVLNEVGEIAAMRSSGGVPGAESGDDKSINSDDLVGAFNTMARMVERENLVPTKMLNYAEIYIYEPELGPDGQMHWEMIAQHNFDRDYMAADGNKASAQMMPILKSLINDGGIRSEEINGMLQEKVEAQVDEAFENIPPVNGAPQESGDDRSGLIPGVSADSIEADNFGVLGIGSDTSSQYQKAVDAVSNGAVSSRIAAHFKDAQPTTSLPTTITPGNTINVNLNEAAPRQVSARSERKPLFHWMKKKRPTHATKITNVTDTVSR